MALTPLDGSRSLVTNLALELDATYESLTDEDRDSLLRKDPTIRQRLRSFKGGALTPTFY